MNQPLKQVLAIDFGASSGRAMLGKFSGEAIELEEIHRFENAPVFAAGTLYWDVLRLLHEIKQSIIKANKLGEIESIAIDTWGVDFGLLDEDGRLLENPVHYRDARTKGMAQESAKHIAPEKLYKTTGNQIMEINTAFQLLALQKQRPRLLQNAQTLLMMPDLFGYFLTGEKRAEQSIASTSQLFNPEKQSWAGDVIAALGLPQSIFPELSPPGAVLGALSAEICEELHVPAVPVVSVCGHDTQSAQLAVPAKEEGFMYISSGTWSLMGTELDAPLLSDDAMRLNITNESAFGGKTSFLKNITGLWLMQETRRQWQKEGCSYSFAQMEDMAKAAAPFKCFINPSDAVFAPAGNIPKRIAEYCVKTGQPAPETHGETLRCIYESLAFTYRNAKEEIEGCVGKVYPRVHVVGGGVKDALLCQMTANACGTGVCAGPAEATVLGNVACQLIACGAVQNAAQARQIVAASQPVNTYEAQEAAKWNNEYKRYCEVAKC